MSRDHGSTNLPAEDVERRLRELAELYDLGLALREVRFLESPLPDRVRERFDSREERNEATQNRGGGDVGPEVRPTPESG